MIYVENKDLVIPGEVLADDDFYSGRGTFRENGRICSSLLGRVSLRNKKIRVIPLKSKYVPKKGDVVIGKVKDVKFSMWELDINSPYSGILPAFEVFGREKKSLNRVYDVGDVLFLRVVEVDEVKKAKLGLKGRRLGKFNGGIIVDMSPTKVPRLIGKKGSMINMIKEKTGCNIIVGQNGLVWVKGSPEMEQLTKDIIHIIDEEAHTSGLTNRIRDKLFINIDKNKSNCPECNSDKLIVDYDKGEIICSNCGSIIEEFIISEESEDYYYDELEKPKLQNFKDELEEDSFDDEEENEDF